MQGENQLEAWLNKKRNVENGWVNPQPINNGAIQTKPGSIIFPIREEDDVGNITDAQFSRSISRLEYPDSPKIVIEASPKLMNPLMLSSGSERMY